jgi:hypothetical protein
MSTRLHKFVLFSASVLLIGSSFAAQADIKYPTDADLHAFQTVCAGGSVKEIKGRVDAALQTWRLKPGVDATLGGTIRDLGAVMEKIKDGKDSALFEQYVSCVQRLIVSYLEHANPPSAAEAPRPTKPQS